MIRDENFYKNACVKTEDEIQQILGKALGFPRYVDDQKNFPGATEKDGVCVGEHVAATLAMQIAGEHARMKKALEEIHGWLVCSAITTAEDFMQNCADMESKARLALNPRDVWAGDYVTRVFAGAPMRMKVTKISKDRIHCRDWVFSMQNGAEIDEELGWNESRTGSYLQEFRP